MKQIIEKREPVNVNITPKIFIKNSGVYKFSESDEQMKRKSSAGEVDFKPTDFIESRKNKYKWISN